MTPTQRARTDADLLTDAIEGIALAVLVQHSAEGREAKRKAEVTMRLARHDLNEAVLRIRLPMLRVVSPA